MNEPQTARRELGREELLVAVPTFIRFLRAYQRIDAETWSLVSEMVSYFDDDSPTEEERFRAAQAIVTALFPSAR